MLKFKRQKKINPERGFIALISTLIITAVLMMALSATSTSSFFARFDALGSEFKRVSLGLSESCLNIALLKIAQNFCYDPIDDLDYVSGKGVKVNVGPDECYISSVTYDTLDCNAGKRVATIKTVAQYPGENGSWSANKIVATIQNPAISTTTPPPTCSFIASPLAIIEGQKITLQWNVSGNATELSVVRSINGSDFGIYSGAPTGGSTEDSPPQNATYAATISGPGGTTNCVSSQSVVVTPPLACSDTVVMLDRTLSMSSIGLNDEGKAGKVLLNLFNAAFPSPPKVGIGRFGGASGSVAEVEPRGEMTDSYGDDDSGNDTDNDLYDAVEEATASNSIGGINLASAINTGDSELNSSRHSSGKSKALVLISNGKPSAPLGDAASDTQAARDAANTAKTPHGSDDLPTEIFTVHFGEISGQNLLAELASNSLNNHLISATAPSIGYKSPAAHAIGSGDGWENWSGVQGDDSLNNASDDDGDSEQYFNFSFSVPVDAIPRGIEVAADAWSFDADGCELGMSLSWDGGNVTPTWTSGVNPTVVETLTGIENTLVFGGSSELWGRVWASGEFANANFRLRVHNIGGASCQDDSKIFIDYLRAKVYYMQTDADAENSDDDHFFIASTSEDIEEIFDTVGKIICPAAIPLLPPGPLPSVPLPPSPPSMISIGSWDEIINILQ